MKKYFVFLIWSFLILYFCSITSAQICDEDCQIRRVRHRFYERENGFSTSFSFKKIALMGDSTAVTLKKIFSISEMVEKNKLSICLEMLKDSFAFPLDVQRKVDRKPKNTLLLLDALKTETKDSENIKMIDETLKYFNDYPKKVKKE
ncbi:MAG TPA: hypothetical protein PKY82_00670 [Pyrinomonadaceae bacterium]|nr:hypothetical protein [Pyrinomonadaceae bacterium]